ncbi:hypothetical protein MRX96_059893 [Rhipicephalus microplus]
MFGTANTIENSSEALTFSCCSGHGAELVSDPAGHVGSAPPRGAAIVRCSSSTECCQEFPAADPDRSGWNPTLQVPDSASVFDLKIPPPDLRPEIRPSRSSSEDIEALNPIVLATTEPYQTTIMLSHADTRLPRNVSFEKAQIPSYAEATAIENLPRTSPPAVSSQHTMFAHDSSPEATGSTTSGSSAVELEAKQVGSSEPVQEAEAEDGDDGSSVSSRLTSVSRQDADTVVEPASITRSIGRIESLEHKTEQLEASVAALPTQIMSTVRESFQDMFTAALTQALPEIVAQVSNSVLQAMQPWVIAQIKNTTQSDSPQVKRKPASRQAAEEGFSGPAPGPDWSSAP